MSSGPCVLLCLEAPDAIKKWRDTMGPTDPAKAEPGTLRRDFGTSIGNNATHGSDAPETAAFELGYFFRMELIAQTGRLERHGARRPRCQAGADPVRAAHGRWPVSRFVRAAARAPAGRFHRPARRLLALCPAGILYPRQRPADAGVGPDLVLYQSGNV
jgi:hypothetical protein